MSSPALRGLVSRSDELVVASTVQYRPCQAAERKLLDQDRAWSNALESRLVDEAVRDAAYFRKD